jgi:hypothetical protein
MEGRGTLMLIERLLGIDKDEIIGTPFKIPCHNFIGDVIELYQGFITAQEVIDKWEMDQATQDEFNLLVLKNPAAKDDQALFILRVQGALLSGENELREGNFKGVADKIRTKLGLPVK